MNDIDSHSYDQVLLNELLEHVLDEHLALRNINRVSAPGGKLIISVPAHTFPKCFGGEWADSIGHLKDGYAIDELRTVLSRAGFEREEWRSYTYWLSSHLSSILYRRMDSSYLRMTLCPLFALLSLMDLKSKEYCSIAAITQKVRESG